MTLQRYLESSWIRKHETSPQEIRDLLAIAERDIAQSGMVQTWVAADVTGEAIRYYRTY